MRSDKTTLRFSFTADDFKISTGGYVRAGQIGWDVQVKTVMRIHYGDSATTNLTLDWPEMLHVSADCTAAELVAVGISVCSAPVTRSGPWTSATVTARNLPMKQYGYVEMDWTVIAKTTGAFITAFGWADLEVNFTNFRGIITAT